MLYFIFLITFSFADFEIQDRTSISGDLYLQISCGLNEKMLCQRICNNYDDCEIKLARCRNCLSTYNQNLSTFFSIIGSQLQTSDKELSKNDVLDFFENPNLMLWTFDSHYNRSEYKGIFAQKRFDSLCPPGPLIKKPIILDKLSGNQNFSLFNSKIVLCQFEDSGLSAYPLEYKE